MLARARLRSQHVLCCCSVAKWCPTLWTHGLQHTRLPCPHYLPDLAQTHGHLVVDAIQPSHPSPPPSSPPSPCCPLLLLPSIFPSIRVFSNESALCMRSKYWSFSSSISPSNEYSGLISFRIDRFDLLAVQGTLKSLLQHHSSKASVL